MDPGARTTQKDIARAAGVHPATVSLALRGHPSIPNATQARIRKLAQKLRYVPDPALAALARYRQARRTSGFHGKVAWLAETTVDFKWRQTAHFMKCFHSACSHAEQLGYVVEVLDLGELGVSPGRASAIAQARGIQGVLVCPQPRAEASLDAFRWERFSNVTFGYSLMRPALNGVTTAGYRAVLSIMREFHRRGYRRVGWAFRPDHDMRVDHGFLAGFLAACRVLNMETDIPCCPDDGLYDGSVLLEWLKQHKPDGLLIGNPGVLPLLASWGYRCPRDLGVACPLLPAKTGGLAGVVEDLARQGMAAMDLLSQMIQRGERGAPELPLRIMCEGSWYPGTSLRPIRDRNASPVRSRGESAR